MAPTIQFKRGSAATTGAGIGTIPALRAGEPGFSTNFYDLFIGFDTSVEGNKFFGSHRYWAREDGTESLRLRLVAADGDVGNSIQLQAPPTHTGITTYTLPATPANGYFLKTNASGELSWENVTGSATFNDATLSGITTITSVQIHGGSINDTTIGLTTAAAAAFTELTYDNSSTSGISTVGELFVGTTQVLHDDGGLITLAGIQTVDATTISTLETLLSLDPNEFDTLNVAGISTFNGDVNLGSDLSDTITVKGTATFEQTVTGTISTATSVNTTETSDGLSFYIPFVSNSSSTTGETVRVGAGISFNPSTNTLGVANIETAAIKHSNGTSAITIDSVGNVGIAQTLTIEGNLTVKGSTTTVNTETLLVKDPVIELGMVDVGGDLLAPSTDSTTDVGTILHYYTDGTAKKASFFWDLGTGRVSVASSVTETDGAIAVVAWGTLEAGSFLMNGKLTVSDCAGSSDVITCNESTNERFLDNITVDAGTF